MPQHQLDSIQSNHANHPTHSQQCLTSVFEWWLKNCVEPTCELLIQAVNTMGRKDVVKQLCEKYGEQLHTVIYALYFHAEDNLK